MVDAVQPAQVVDEPVFFPESSREFFGLVTSPVDRPHDGVGILLMSGVFGGTTTIGRNRHWVRLARRLAADGHIVLRLDYHGLGDSRDDDSGYQLERPAMREVASGFELLLQRGADRLIPIGTCYGARNLLHGSVAEDRVAALLLFAPPIRDGIKGGEQKATDHLSDIVGTRELVRRGFTVRTMRKLLSSSRARSVARRVFRRKLGSLRKPGVGSEWAQMQAIGGFVQPLIRLLDRGVPVHLMFGVDDYTWKEYEVAMRRGLEARLEPYGGLLTVSTVPGLVRGFVSERIQDVTLDAAREFAARHTS